MKKFYELFSKQYEWAFDNEVPPGYRGMRCIVLAIIHSIVIGAIYALLYSIL